MVSAVILGYNRVHEVLVTIDKLKSYAASLPFILEIIVVDNASVDSTSESVKEKFPDIELVTLAENVGIAGWNAGFEVAKQKYLLVLDDDSHVESGLPEAIAYMEKHKQVGILALNVTSGPYLTDDWVWGNGKPWQHEEEILGFFGCGAIIKNEVFKKIGGFAAWLYMYAHEWEYGLRCLDAGYSIRYFKTSSVIHRASGINRNTKNARIYDTRNELSIVYKYFGKNRWKYIWRMFLNNLKHAKHESIKVAWYDIIGTIRFMKWRKSLPHTPVSEEVQQFFADNYRNTFPFLRFLRKAGKKKTGRLAS